MCVCVCVRERESVCKCIYIYIYVHMRVRVYVCVCVCVCECMCVKRTSFCALGIFKITQEKLHCKILENPSREPFLKGKAQHS
jgi:hypothetical protein